MNVNDVLESSQFKPDDSASMQQLFQRWKVQLNKSYPTPEAEAQAFAEFQKSVKTVMQHNAEQKQGQHSFTMGLNQFSDGTKPCCGLAAPTSAPAVEQVDGAEPPHQQQQHHAHHHHHKHHAQHAEHQGEHQAQP